MAKFMTQSTSTEHFEQNWDGQVPSTSDRLEPGHSFHSYLEMISLLGSWVGWLGLEAMSIIPGYPLDGYS